ncbi:MAG: GNAT family N-acetyltransferase [Promethearchaeota archaeon]
MVSYIIREPRIDEIHNSIKVLYLSFDRTVPSDIKEEKKLWVHLINNNIAKFLIAVKEDKILGIGGLFLFQQVGSIGYMGVLSEYRSIGIGTAIFKKLMEIALTFGYKTIMLYASKLGEVIYRKYGFQGSYYATTYLLPKKVPKLHIKNKNIKIISTLPDWLLKLDKKTVGFDRSKYLKAKLVLGAKVLIVGNEGYALISKVLSKVRLGPLIANNLDAALQLIKKSIPLGVNNLIVPKHPFFQNEILTLMQLTEKKDSTDLKMIYGEEISGKIGNLYAIGTYAKG